jgi:hypothetical protein
MPEEVIFETERDRSRSEIADTLRSVADKLDDGEELTIRAGEESVTLAVPNRPTFEIKAEREGHPPATELSVEFELEWDENETDSDEVAIE